MENTGGNKEIFREKSMERLSAPEELNGYLRITGPGVWVVLLGLIVLILGLLVWGGLGTLSSSVIVPAKAENGKVSCYVLGKDLNNSDEEIDIYIGDLEMEAKKKEAKEVTLDASSDPELFSSGYLTAGKKVMVLTCETSLQDGFYAAEVVTEVIHPLSLLFAKS